VTVIKYDGLHTENTQLIEMHHSLATTTAADCFTVLVVHNDSWLVMVSVMVSVTHK